MFGAPTTTEQLYYKKNSECHSGQPESEPRFAFAGMTEQV